MSDRQHRSGRRARADMTDTIECGHCGKRIDPSNPPLTCTTHDLPRAAADEGQMSDDAKALACGIASLHMIAGAFTVSSAYRDAAKDAIKVLTDVAADRDEWKLQHENLLAVRKRDIAALAATIERLERDRDALKAALRELVSVIDAAPVVTAKSHGLRFDAALEAARVLAAPQGSER